MNQKNKTLTANALLSSILVLTTCLLFLHFYQEIYRNNMQNSFLLIEYLINDGCACLLPYFY